MNTKSKKLEDWKSCDSGFLVAFSERAKSARDRRIATRSSIAAFAVVFAVVLGVGSMRMWLNPRENHFGGIACHEVQENMQAMMAGAISDELRTRIEAHLRECPICREMMQKMSAGHAAAGVSHDFWTCDCPECQRPLAHATLQVAQSARMGESVLAMSTPPGLAADQR